MSTVYTTPALAGAFMLGLATAAYAVTGQFDNMCSWGLANHKDVQTNCSVNTTIKGNTYCFSSEDAKNQFRRIRAVIWRRPSPSIRANTRAKLYKDARA
jgi:hypothetical protein